MSCFCTDSKQKKIGVGVDFVALFGKVGLEVYRRFVCLFIYLFIYIPSGRFYSCRFYLFFGY